MTKLEFWENVSIQKESSVVVDLRKAIAAYQEVGGAGQRAECQFPKMGKRKRTQPIPLSPSFPWYAQQDSNL